MQPLRGDQDATGNEDPEEQETEDTQDAEDVQDEQDALQALDVQEAQAVENTPEVRRGALANSRFRSKPRQDPIRPSSVLLSTGARAKFELPEQASSGS